ncbi:hypothetical protein LTR36_009533 [Oleoguttula mirabilis]|uniref:DUF3074 domain-containing protein n=1 Tax=Oleoguttula mirabilis TaxID=1507867 RepID=A0AAV9JT09_9PEZI|nr:hypothetical protein LTR36_009533 [Oleoguttula mirabilis]
MAADLHDALKALAPVQWPDVPLDDLPTYLTSAFTAGELICNSVPPSPNGQPFHSSKPHHKTPNQATSAKEMHASLARASPPHKHHEDLQRHWGKPYKFKAEQNPHGVILYKMAGHDRHGAWFARRSVHEGLGFARFKKAMQREFPHSLTVQGGPGAGAVRGLAGDKRLEQIDVDGVGQLEVFQLSAQFPGPVTPRDFLTMILTTDDALGEKSAAEVQDGTKHVPRHYMIVSKPVEHPDAPERSGFVRGKYESVEMIREIPLHPAQTKSTPNQLASEEGEGHHGRDRGRTTGSAESRGSEARDPSLPDTHSDGEGAADPELNPVEWIMITRSDPGGGIPRFLVERGTPEAMLGDITKFLDWACKVDEVPDPEDGLKQQNDLEQHTEGATTQAGESGTSAPNGVAHDRAAEKSVATQSTPVQQQQQQGGIMSNMAGTLEAGVDAYAPTSVSQGVHNYLHPTTQEEQQDGQDGQDDTSDSSSDTSSAESFASAEEMRRNSTARETLLPQHHSDSAASASTGALSLASQDSTTELAAAASTKEGKKQLNSHEKEVLKLAREREKLDRKLAKKRADEEGKMKKSQDKEQTDQEKVKEKHEKDIKKAEERHRKEIEKLERRQEREARKAEEKRLKKDDANKLSLVSRERDEFRSQLDSHKRENQLLLERMEELQRENTVMAQRLGKLGGSEAVRSVQEEVEMGRKRAGSQTSRRSLESGGSGKKEKEALGL